MRPSARRPNPPRGTATSASRRLGGRNATAVMEGVGYMQAGHCSLCTIGPQPVVSPFGHPAGARICRRCIHEKLVGLMDRMTETLGLPRTGRPISQPPLVQQIWFRRLDTGEEVGSARRAYFDKGLLVVEAPFIFGSIDGVQRLDVVVQDWETQWDELGPEGKHRVIPSGRAEPVLERCYRIDMPEDLDEVIRVPYEIVQPS